MNESNDSPLSTKMLDVKPLTKERNRRGPGRGIGEKRIAKERLDELDTLFHNLEEIHAFLIQEGHAIINESGSMLSSGSHQNLDRMLVLLEDFLWVLNCAIAKHGGSPRLLK